MLPLRAWPGLRWAWNEAFWLWKEMLVFAARLGENRVLLAYCWDILRLSNEVYWAPLFWAKFCPGAIFALKERN